jgi:hypothetical protein
VKRAADGLAAGVAVFQAFVLGQVIFEAGVASKAARQTWQGYSGSSSSSSSRSMGVA